MSSLAEFLKQARHYAEFAMRKFGNVAPMIIAVAPKGPIHFVPHNLTDERAKDNFANTARLIPLHGFRPWRKLRHGVLRGR